MKWTPCPHCDKVGNQQCHRCLGVGGWYSAGKETSIDELLTEKPKVKSQAATTHAITPDNMSDNLATELLNELDLGDWEVSQWEADFIDSCLRRETFSVKQKGVIYKMALRFKLL